MHVNPVLCGSWRYRRVSFHYFFIMIKQSQKGFGEKHQEANVYKLTVIIAKFKGRISKFGKANHAIKTTNQRPDYSAECVSVVRVIHCEGSRVKR